MEAAVRVPPATVRIYVGGTFDRTTRRVVGGSFQETAILPANDGGREVVIGRDDVCTYVVADATKALSRKAAVIRRSQGRIELWARSGSGGVVHLHDGPELPIPCWAEGHEKPKPLRVDVTHGSVVELVIGTNRLAHLVFDIPVAAIMAPPSLEGSPTCPTTNVVGRAEYALTPADKEMLTAISPDLVVTPPFGIAIASAPAVAAWLLARCAVEYFDGKGDRESYDANKLNATLAGFVGRIAPLEEAAAVPYEAQLSVLVSSYKEELHCGTLGVDAWLQAHPEIVSELDADLATAMREVRDDYVRARRDMQARNGMLAATKAHALRRGEPTAIGDPR